MSSKPLEIRLVQTPADRKAFVELPWKIYRDDPNWVPPLLSMAYEIIDTEKHPFYEFAHLALFTAWRGDRMVGRIAAIDNPNHNAAHADRVGFFGFFEAENDPEAAQALFDAAGDWLRARGKDAVRGPANPSVNDEYGLLVDGFDVPPVILMPYNPPYYVDLIEAAGFEKAMDLLAWYVPTSFFGGTRADKIPKKLKRVVKAVKRRYGYTIRPLNMRNFDDEADRIKVVYRAAWEKNWGAVAMTDHEIDHLAAGLKQMADPDLVFIVEDREGNVAGIAVTLPDLNQALLRAYPRPGVPELWTLLKLLWHWKVRSRVDGVRILALGVLERYRSTGVDALLMYEITRVGLSKGYKWGEMSWILETNDMMNRDIELMGGRVYKTYRVYQKPL
ncbi:MAG: N-acetyltransferase [Anaerolineae bacterium]|nr:MAG: N-acetyltransferase [Anaerolineae bacterium]